jgi:hypothetical protein
VDVAGTLVLAADLQASKNEVVAAAIPRKRPVLRKVLFSIMMDKC